MKQPKLRPISLWQLRCAALLLATVAACGHGDYRDNDPARRILDEADELEKDGSKYGSIWVGAVRVADYDAEGLWRERDDRRKTLRNDWDFAAQLKLSDLKPERIEQRSQRLEATVAVELPVGAGTSANGAGDRAPPSGHKTGDGSTGFSAIGANPTGLLGRKLALLNRIQSELEEEDLSNFSAVDGRKYHRIQLSLSLTAWTQGQARAAVVYMDVYPFNGDRACHEVGERAAKYNGGDKGKAEAVAELQKRFYEAFLRGAFVTPPPELPPAEFEMWLGKGDAAYGMCHTALDAYYLLPKLVKVESLGDTIFAGTRQQSDYGVGGKLKSKPVTMEAEGATGADVVEEDVAPTTLSFAAGSRRAGWFLMAKGKDGKTMNPVERRVRLVIDVPIQLKRLEVHVHKSFLDSNENLASGFGDQLDKSIRARNLLDRIEGLYPSDPKCPAEQLFCSPTQWQLTKTRARNLSDHAWSERLIVDVDPAIFTNQKIVTVRKSELK